MKRKSMRGTGFRKMRRLTSRSVGHRDQGRGFNERSNQDYAAAVVTFKEVVRPSRRVAGWLLGSPIKEPGTYPSPWTPATSVAVKLTPPSRESFVHKYPELVYFVTDYSGLLTYQPGLEAPPVLYSTDPSFSAYVLIHRVRQVEAAPPPLSSPLPPQYP